MKDLKMELIQLNEAIDMIKTALEWAEEEGEDDPQMVAQLEERLKERDELIEKINSLQ